MDFSMLNELIGSVGFPIASVGVLAWYIKYTNDQTHNERKEERDALLNEVKYNREVNTELLATNRILAADIKIELTDIKNELKNLNG